MKHSFILSLVLVILSVSGASEPLPVSVFHWNDLHSFNTPQAIKNPATGQIDSLGGVQFLSGLLIQWRTETPRAITLNAGDEFTGGPISALQKGSNQAPIQNRLKPQMIAVGNHEFDYGLDALHTFQSLLDTSITLASANLISNESKRTLFSKEKIYHLNGVDIGVIAFTLEGLANVVHPSQIKEIQVSQIFPLAKDFVERMELKADVLIALTHQGVYDDVQLAMNVPGFDVIVGGHSHALIDRDFIIHGTRIVQAGYYGRYLGRVDLMVDTSSNQVVQSSSRVFPVGPNRGINADAEMMQIIQQQEQIIHNALGKQIGELQTDFLRTYDSESNVGSWVSETVKQFTSSDIGIYNSGGLRVDWYKGPLILKDVWQLEPFGNNIVKIKVTGKELFQMFTYRLQVTSDYIQASGIQITSNSNEILQMNVQGKPVELEKHYWLASNSYVASQWDKYFGFSLSDHNIIDFGTPVKEALIQRIEQEKKISAIKTNWWSKQ